MDSLTRDMVEYPIAEEAVRRFASEKHLAGWYHNPYALEHALEQKSPDAQATAVAEEYIELFTAALRKRGLMPFTGVEINFDSHTASDAIPQGQSNTGDFAELISGKQSSETKIVFRLKKIGQWLLEEQAKSNIRSSSDAEAFAYAEAVIENAEQHDEAVVEEQKDIYKTLLETAKDKIPHTLFFNPMANGEGVYQDTSNVEVCTPPLSPIDTVKLVNFYKRVFFEASDEFSRAFDADNPDAADACRHPIANWLKNGVEPFNISYTLDSNFSGEHVSLSLQADKGQQKDYDTALTTNIGMDFFEDNLMGHGREWANLVLEVFKLRLGSDKILTTGLSSAVAPTVGNVNSRFNVEMFQQMPREETNRVETRHFHYSGSNVALSMVGMLANLYAIVLAVEEVERTLKKDFIENPEQLSEAVRAVVKRELAKIKSRSTTDIHTLDALKKGFKEEGLTLDMMRAVTEEAYGENPDEKQKALVNVKKFEDAVCKRATDIMMPNAKEIEVGR